MAKGRFTIFPSRIGGVEAVEAATGHVFARHTHEQFGIGLIHQGAQKSLSGRGVVEAGAGDMITVNPGEVHDGMPIGDAGRSWRMLYFDPAVIADAMEDISQGKTRTAEFTAPVFHDGGDGETFSGPLQRRHRARRRAQGYARRGVHPFAAGRRDARA